MAVVKSKDLFVGNHDILLQVFSMFLPLEGNNDLSLEHKKELRNFALVCKGFRDPALDCLWMHLDGLMPLLKLHPALEVIDGSHFFLCSRPDDPATKFMAHARRVRSLSLATDKARAHPISPAGMAWLGQKCRNGSLLPCLRKVSFQDPKTDSVEAGLLPLLISPLITTVEFKGALLSASAFNTYVLPLICNEVPSVQHLSSDDTSSTTSSIWFALPSLFRGLQLKTLVLKLPNNMTLTANFLSQLGSDLEALTSLTLDIHTGSHSAHSSGPPPATGFPNLVTLHLINRSSSELCKCYPNYLIQKATTVTFMPTANVLGTFAFSVAARTLFNAPGLREVVISAVGLSVLALATVPLLELPGLGTLSVEAGAFRTNGPYADNDLGTIIKQASSRKDKQHTGRLQTLLLPTNWTSESGYKRVYASLDTLASISRTAPGLERLSLSIVSNRVTSVMFGPTLESLTASHTRLKVTSPVSQLRYLEIADGRPSNVPFKPSECRAIALFLDTIFPNLLQVSLIEHADRDKTWDEHWDLIEEHRRMRKALRIRGVASW